MMRILFGFVYLSSCLTKVGRASWTHTKLLALTGAASYVLQLKRGKWWSGEDLNLHRALVRAYPSI